MHRSPGAPFWLVLACCLGGVCLQAAPQSLASLWRQSVHDLLQPGERAARGIVDALNRGRTWLATREQPGSEHADEHRRQLAASTQTIRRLQLELAQAHAELAKARQEYGLPVQPTDPLFRPELVEARRLGTELAGLWPGRNVIDVGSSSGVASAALIVEPETVLLDQGQQAGIAGEQPVFTGRVVVGKIADIGRWTSRVQLVTDAGYRGFARLVHQSSQGARFGAEGILEGDGTAHCRLEWIPSTATVSVGDLVVTSQTDGGLPAPMVYGVVVSAELTDEAPRWNIRVQPAMAAERLQRVQVLRAVLNPLRQLTE